MRARRGAGARRISTGRRDASPILHALGAGFSEALWPTRCVGCDAPGTLLCERCSSLLPAIDQQTACPSCGAPFGNLVCTECGPQRDCAGPSTLDGVACFGVHAWPLDRLVRAYKDWDELRLAPVIGQLVAEAAMRADAAGHLSLRDVGAVAFVPATPSAYARRGRDHMAPVAAHVARALRVPCVDMLARRDVRDQRGLTRAQRASNAASSLVAVRQAPCEGLLLVDDVVTTGATLRAAAAALRAAGAIRVWGACAARAW